MDTLIKDVTFGGGKQFVVRCMQRGSKYRSSLYGVLDIVSNTFVMSGQGMTKEEATYVLKTATLGEYEAWARHIHELMALSK